MSNGCQHGMELDYPKTACGSFQASPVSVGPRARALSCERCALMILVCRMTKQATWVEQALQLGPKAEPRQGGRLIGYHFIMEGHDMPFKPYNSLTGISITSLCGRYGVYSRHSGKHASILCCS